MFRKILLADDKVNAFGELGTRCAVRQLDVRTVGSEQGRDDVRHKRDERLVGYDGLFAWHTVRHPEGAGCHDSGGLTGRTSLDAPELVRIHDGDYDLGYVLIDVDDIHFRGLTRIHHLQFFQIPLFVCRHRQEALPSPPRSSRESRSSPQTSCLLLDVLCLQASES